MPIYVYGMSHASAPLDVRDRTEIVVHAGDAKTGEALRRFIAGERSVPEEELERHCYLHADRDAVRHVFRVSSSLDSMILGEAQILGQVKEAYAAAVRARALGAILDALMRRSFAVAKKVRSETGVARHPVSIAHAAAGLARDIFGDLREKAILIVGAGKMARAQGGDPHDRRVRRRLPAHARDLSAPCRSTSTG